MTDFDASRAVAVLRVLASAPRLSILQRLLDGECVVAELEAGLTIRQPGLSQHLAELRDVGLVTSRREARSVFYRLADPGAHHLVASVLAGFGAPPPASATARPADGFGAGGMIERPAGVARFARVLS